MLTRQLRVLGLLLALFGGIATATATTGAQEFPTTPVLVMAVTCTDANCADVDTAPREPGITVHAWDSTDDVWLASCTTDSSSQSGGCTFEVPEGVDYYLTWEPATIEGYTFLGDLIPVNDPQAPSGWIIPFVPEAVDPSTTLLANAALCTDASCAVFETTLTDFEIEVFNAATSDFLDSCITPQGSQNGACELVVPADVSDFTFDWRPDQVPAGYSFHSVIVSDGQMGPVVNTLAFAPDVPQASVAVNALLCADAACTDGAGDWIDGFEISAYEDGTDTLLASCVTELQSQFGGCVLEFPATTPDFYFDWDPAQVPAGYEFFDILVSDGEMGPVVHTLAFAPEGPAPTETPVTPQPTTTPAPTATATSTAISGLPATGTTGSGETGSTGMLLAAAGVVLAGAALLGASRLRTRK